MKSKFIKIFSVAMTFAVLLSLCACKGKTAVTTTEKTVSEETGTDQNIEMDYVIDTDTDGEFE